MIIIVGNSIDTKEIKKKNFDLYYVNNISRKMNFSFIKKYKKILIIEPYFGNILERRVKKMIKKISNIHTISYQETIIHKYGSKLDQDRYLKFDKKNILRKINELSK